MKLFFTKDTTLRGSRAASIPEVKLDFDFLSENERVYSIVKLYMSYDKY